MKALKSWLLLGFSLAFLVPFVHAQLPKTERAALIALYQATNGDAWTNNAGWKVSPDTFSPPGTEGGWYGVTVEGDHVVGLYLTGNNLTGSIPAQIGNFPWLWVLELNSNQLSGQIPPELGNLTGLGWFSLSSNQLAGSIPAGLGGLQSLLALGLDNNQLSGEIPVQLGNLTSLEAALFGPEPTDGDYPP